MTNLLIESIVNKLTPVDTEQLFADMLDECEAPVRIGTLTYSPSDVLREVDPVAFNCGEGDYTNSLEQDGTLIEVRGEYYYTDEVEALQESIESVEE